MSVRDVLLLLVGMLIGYLLAFDPFAAIVVALILVLILLVAGSGRALP